MSSSRAKGLKLTTMVCFCWLLHVDTYRLLHSLRVAFANDNQVRFIYN